MKPEYLFGLTFMFCVMGFVALNGLIYQVIYLRARPQKPESAPPEWSQENYSTWREWAMGVHENRLCKMLLMPILMLQFGYLGGVEAFFGYAKSDGAIGLTGFVLAVMETIALCLYYGQTWPVVLFLLVIASGFVVEKIPYKNCALAAIVLISLPLMILNDFATIEIKAKACTQLTDQICSDAVENCAFAKTLLAHPKLMTFHICVGTRTELQCGFVNSVLHITKDSLTMPTDTFKTALTYYAKLHDVPLVHMQLTPFVFSLWVIFLAAICFVQCLFKEPDCDCYVGASACLFMGSALIAFVFTEAMMWVVRVVCTHISLGAIKSIATTLDSATLASYLLTHPDEWAVTPWIPDVLVATAPTLRSVLKAVAAKSGQDVLIVALEKHT